MLRIHQLTAGFRYGDAISDEALLLRDLIRSHGIDSDIYCNPLTISPHTSGNALNVGTLQNKICPDDIALLHLSIGSPINSFFRELPCRKVILYHNVTPPEFFRYLDPMLARRLADGRKQVAALAGAADINLADSAYNAAELEDMGYSNVRVFPLVVNIGRLGPKKSVVDKDYRNSLNDGRKNILFVGRVVPNKRCDKLIEVFSYFQHYVEPQSRLIIAGSIDGESAYNLFCQGAIRILELERVTLTGFLPVSKLNACFSAAHAFLCMSDHEGFCAPLLEAMAWNIPVFANARAAVPETMSGAGVLFNGATSAEIAETIGRVLKDPVLKADILARQNKRLAEYRNRDVWAEFCSLTGI